jgi:PmbA protein
VPKPSELLEIAQRALAELPSGWTGDVRAVSERWGTMRFALGRLGQPQLEDESYVSLRAVRDHRVGIAASTDVSASGLAQLAETAQGIARVAPPDAAFPEFPASTGRLRSTAYSEATARLSPADQARLADEALEGARSVQPRGRIAGVVNVGREIIAVANTSGLGVVAPRSVVQASVLVDRPDLDVPVSGWDETAHWDVAGLHAARLGRAAAERVPTGATESATPGKYRVLLCGPAASELLSFLAYLGFNSRGVEEGWSCLTNLRGKRVAPSSVELVDDGTSARSIPRAFDLEGTPKHRLHLVEDGVAGDAVADLRSAARRGVTPTGHGTYPESPWGDFGASPSNVLLTPGDASFDDLVRTVRDGVLVTRLNYVRVVHPARSIITGMTRDGTYRIRNGEVGPAIRNFRFTESVLATLGSIEQIGRATRRYSDERGGGTVTTPAIAVGAFHFTSATLF